MSFIQNINSDDNPGPLKDLSGPAGVDS